MNVNTNCIQHNDCRRINSVFIKHNRPKFEFVGFIVAHITRSTLIFDWLSIVAKIFFMCIHKIKSSIQRMWIQTIRTIVCSKIVLLDNFGAIQLHLSRSIGLFICLLFNLLNSFAIIMMAQKLHLIHFDGKLMSELMIFSLFAHWIIDTWRASCLDDATLTGVYATIWAQSIGFIWK